MRIILVNIDFYRKELMTYEGTEKLPFFKVGQDSLNKKTVQIHFFEF